MNSRNNINGLLIFAVAAILLFAFGTVRAGMTGNQVLFSEDFENPVVTGYAQGTAPNFIWVKANQGYNGTKHGMINVDSGAYTADAGNNQAYAFRYTNSGLTTAEGYIGVLTLGLSYTVSFDVATDNGAAPYRVQLIAFATEAARNDCRSTPSGSTMLAQTSGNAPTDHIGDTKVSFRFTPNEITNAADFGKDIGVRLIGATTSAIIDNVKVVADYGPVDAGQGVITWSGRQVVMAPYFADDFIPASYLWTVDAGSAADSNLDIVIDDPNTANPTVNITKLSPTGEATVVTMTLTASDGVNPSEDDYMFIEVYDDSCAAGILTGLKQYKRGDLNSDCITDMKDFAIMAFEWLYDYSITSPVPRP